MRSNPQDNIAATLYALGLDDDYSACMVHNPNGLQVFKLGEPVRFISERRMNRLLDDPEFAARFATFHAVHDEGEQRAKALVRSA